MPDAISSYKPVATYGVTEEMLNSVSSEYRAALLMVDSEIRSLENDHSRRSELRNRLQQARMDLVNAYTDWMFVAQNVGAVASGPLSLYSESFGKGVAAFAPVAGQLNQQDIQAMRNKSQTAESLEKELEGDTRKVEETLQRVNRLIEQIAEMRVQVTRSA